MRELISIALKIRTKALLAMVAAALALPCALLLATPAMAAENSDPANTPPTPGTYLTYNGSTIVGTFEVTGWRDDYSYSPMRTYFSVKLNDTYGLLHADGATGTYVVSENGEYAFKCIDPGKAIPGKHQAGVENDQYGEFEAYVVSVSGNNVSYKITCYPYGRDPRSNGQWWKNYGMQRVEMSTFVVTYNWTAPLSVKKSSANPDCTDDNPNYSLAGAVYRVYAGTDPNCTSPLTDDEGKVIELITDEDGESNEVELKPGYYFVKEYTAPLGYELDEDSYRVQVAGEGAVLEVEDTPLNDPFGIQLEKVDANTGEAVALGGASLALAEYSFSYYTGIYASAAEAEASGETPKVWVLRTDEKGWTSLRLGGSTFQYNGTEVSYKVSGPDFFEDENGKITSPAGSWVVKETKAPEGFLLSDEVFFATLSIDASGALVWSGDTSIVAGQEGGASVKAAEAPSAFGIAIEKTISGTGADEVSPEGIAFDIVAKSSGEKVARLVLDAEGKAASSADALPYDVYEVVEDESTLPKDDKGAYIVQPWSHTDGAGSAIVATVDMADYDNGTLVSVKAVDWTGEDVSASKLDAQTGDPVAGATFVLYSYPVELVAGRVQTAAAAVSADDPKWEKVAQLVSAADGSADFGLLQYGLYKIVEEQAPADYAMPWESGDAGYAIFTVDRDHAASVKVFEDEPLTTGCIVEKETNSVTSAGLVAKDIDGNVLSNIGEDAYPYRVSFASTSDCYADEFWVEDSCEMTGDTYQLRISRIWLPAVTGDTDGRVHLLIKNASDPVGNADGMDFSQASLHKGSLAKGQRFDTTGWTYVGEFDATAVSEVDLSFLNATDRIVGIALCYGAVEVGFASTEPLYYLVEATVPLPEGTLIPNSATSHISRNHGSSTGLSHDAEDSVLTAVDTTFELEFDPYVLHEDQGGTHGSWISRILPATGDSAGILPFALASAAGLCLLGIALLIRRPSKRRAGDNE